MVRGFQMLVLALVLCLFCQAALAAPKAVVEPAKIDLGVIRQGTIAETSFNVRNEGDEDLIISKIQISCPCTTVDLPEPNAVPPGASVTLPVHYDSSDRFGPSTATISVSLNDPAMPYAIVDVDVTVKTLVITKPDKGFEFGLSSRGYELKKTVTLGAGEKNTDMEVLDIKFDQPTITAKAEKSVVKEFTRIDLKFFLTPDAPLGDYTNRFVAKVRVGSEETEVKMPVKGFVVGDVVVLPPAIHDPIKGYKQGEHISEITVYPGHKDERCPKVLGVLAVGPLKASVTPNPPENKYVISVDTADSAPGGPRAGMVYIMTASKDQPVVGIPVYWKVAKALETKPENMVFVMSGGAMAADSQPQTKWVSTSVWYEPWTWGTGNNVAAPGSIAAQRITMTNPQGKSFTVKEVRCEDDLLKATIIKPASTGTGDPAAIEIVPTGLIDPARAATTAIVMTDCPGAEEFLVPVLLQPQTP